MTIETRNNGIEDVTVLIADEGKTFRRISDGQEFGNEIWLGFTYYIGGVKLSEPHLETPEDYEEIPDTEPIVEPLTDESDDNKTAIEPLI